MFTVLQAAHLTLCYHAGGYGGWNAVVLATVVRDQSTDR